MNVPCSVICDLLPLVEEGLASEESCAAVREHLDGCAACREKLEAMRQPAEPAAESAAPMKKLKNELRRRRWRTAAIAALAVFVLLFALLARATAAKPLPYSPELIRVEGLEPYDSDGSGFTMEGWETAYPGQALVISRNARVSGVESTFLCDDNPSEYTVYLQYYSTDLKLAAEEIGKGSSEEASGGGYVKDVLYPVPDRVIYGFGAEQELLWGEPMNGGMQSLPRLALAYYALIATGLAVLCAILWLVFRKKRAGGVFRQLCLAPLSYLLGQLLVKGAETTSEFLQRDLAWIGLEALAFYLLLTLALRAWRQRRAERA